MEVEESSKQKRITFLSDWWHTGIGKMRAAICARFYWYGMCVDIENWVCVILCSYLSLSIYIFLSDRYWNLTVY